jgi:hypothetical protein
MCVSLEAMNNLPKCAVEAQGVTVDGRSTAFNFYEMKLEVL